MKFEIEDINTVKKRIRIEVPPEDVAKETDKAFVGVAKKAKVPGFRPGKTPRHILERHYGEEVRSDVINRLIPFAYFTAVREHNIHPVETPEISDISMEKGSPLVFSATVEVRPDIALGSYDDIEINDPDVAVSEEEIDQTIKRLQEMYSQLEVVEGRPVDNNDTVIIDFEGFRDGNPIQGAKAEDHMVALGSGALIPGFEEQIVGMQKGETKDIRVTFPQDYSNKELAGLDAVFKVAIKEIKKAVLPEINDEFARDIGGHKTMEELRGRIKEDIHIRKQNDKASSQKEQIVSRLVEAHSFDAPPSLVERELDEVVRELTVRMARQGVDMKTFDEASYRQKYRAAAERRVKGMLLLDVISEKENVEAADDEVKARLNEMARVSGRPVEAIRKYYESKDSGLDHLKSAIVQEKILSLLLSRAKKVYNKN